MSLAGYARVMADDVATPVPRTCPVCGTTLPERPIPGWEAAQAEDQARVRRYAEEALAGDDHGIIGGSPL